ncbi:Kelch repeat-containing protein [Nocardia pseudovaccinii]|uniref:Kelch repeat-containing protein n=1 Tax=Nocardia pseudovaccinii TaxID=189540 RepID=UPI0007A4D3EE|nr:hypothetical protein [Nocardia pseudovaccinii]
MITFVNPSAATETEAAVIRVPGGGAWSAAGRLPVAVNLQAPDDNAVVLNDGRVLLVGGTDATFAPVPTCAVFDPVARVWTMTGSLAAPRHTHSTTLLADGTVLAVGGLASGPPGLATAERYNPIAGSWSPAGEFAVGRAAHTATRLADGRVLVAGGYSLRQGTFASTAEAAIYDPVGDTWTATKPMNEARDTHRAVLLRDGRVLVIGGASAVGAGSYTGLALCEIFDPHTGAWTPTGSMARPRWNNTATVLADGTVLVTGGGWSGMVSGWVYNAHGDWTTERFDPATGRWTRDADLPNARLWHRAVPLHDGRVLVVGGGSAPALAVGYRSCALYDPRTRGWRRAAGLRTGRWAFAAVPLLDGRVLVTGGVDDLDQSKNIWNLTDTTELYTPPEGTR